MSRSVPLGEPPPPAPKAFFGRDQLIGEVVGLAESLESIVLIGAVGIGKTSIALTALHHDRIKERFGENRRFIRCSQFPASPADFLSRLSQAVGAGLGNPEDLTSLRPFLSSKEIFIILDGAEFIFDPHATNAQGIYRIVEELCQFDTICLCITSRIVVVPPCCTRLEIPTLSMEAACDIFNGVYGNGERSGITNDLIRRLDFNPLSVTLLANIASRNAWDHDQLAKEWATHGVDVLRRGYESLGVTVGLSLTSPWFRSLGPNARGILEVIACFPRGIDTVDLDWFFSAVPDRKRILDAFCVLSLAYMSEGFINVPAPIRDYLSPRGPKSFPFLSATKDSSPSSELQSWNISSDLPSMAPVCIGELAANALIQDQADYLIVDGERLSSDSEEEWMPVSLIYEHGPSEMQDTICIRTPASAGSKVELPRDEPLGVVEQKIASKLGPMLGRGSIRVEARIHKESLNVSSNEFLLNLAH